MVKIKKKAYAGKIRPDQEIVTLANKVSEATSAHKKTFTTAAAALAVIAILVCGFLLKRSMDERNAAPLLAAAYEHYGSNAGPNVDYAKALDLFRAAAKKYPSTKSGSIAAYYAGNCLVNLGRNDEALKEYQSFISAHGSDKFLRGLVYTRMGYLYNQMGKQAEAIKAFGQADALSGPGIATYELAKLYDATGNSLEAQKKYKVIAEKLAGTELAMESVGKIQKPEPAPAPAPAMAQGKDDKGKAAK